MRASFFTAAAICVGGSLAASAADLPYRKAPAPYVAVPVFTWTGFYVGVNAGYGFAGDNDNRGAFFVLPTGFVANSAATNGILTVNNGLGFNRNRDGFVGGGQAGYNYQFGAFVVGVETDIQYADLGGGRSPTVVTNLPNYAFAGTTGAAFAGARNVVVTGFRTNSLDYFGTLRGRVGVAFDRLLVYGTGGFAYGDGAGRTGSSIKTGYAAGGGVEYAFTPSLTGKVEGLYVDLGNGRTRGFYNTAVYTAANNAVTITGGRVGRGQEDFAVVRAGLNYKFSWY